MGIPRQNPMDMGYGGFWKSIWIQSGQPQSDPRSSFLRFQEATPFLLCSLKESQHRSHIPRHPGLPIRILCLLLFVLFPLDRFWVVQSEEPSQWPLSSSHPGQWSSTEESKWLSPEKLPISGCSNHHIFAWQRMPIGDGCSSWNRPLLVHLLLLNNKPTYPTYGGSSHMSK